MDGHEINITKDAGPSPNDLGHTYLTSARNIWEEAGCPKDFAVYQKTAADYDLILYFNTEARSRCAGTGLLSVGRPCNQPDDPGALMIP